MGRLAAKVALITGAAAGQGRVAATTFAAEGARVALTDIDAPALEETRRLVEAAGGAAIAITGDIADSSTSQRLTEAALESFGRVDVLYSNAGIAQSKPMEDYTKQDFDRLMEVNCWSQLAAAQAVLPAMRDAGAGSIINVSSVGGLVALPQLSAYCASKAAVIGLTRAIAYENAEYGIRCNAICPGAVDTPMAQAVLSSFPDPEAALPLLTGRQMLKRFAESREVVALAVFLASDEASFITAAAVPVEAGMTAW